MLALVGAGARAAVLDMANKAMVAEATVAPQPVTLLLLQVVMAKAADLLDRAAMVVNQLSAVVEGMPPTLSKAIPHKEVTKLVASPNKEASSKVIRVVISTNP